MPFVRRPVCVCVANSDGVRRDTNVEFWPTLTHEGGNAFRYPDTSVTSFARTWVATVTAVADRSVKCALSVSNVAAVGSATVRIGCACLFNTAAGGFDTDNVLVTARANVATVVATALYDRMNGELSDDVCTAAANVTGMPCDSTATCGRTAVTVRASALTRVAPALTGIREQGLSAPP